MQEAVRAMYRVRAVEDSMCCEGGRISRDTMQPTSRLSSSNAQKMPLLRPRLEGPEYLQEGPGLGRAVEAGVVRCSVLPREKNALGGPQEGGANAVQGRGN